MVATLTYGAPGNPYRFSGAQAMPSTPFYTRADVAEIGAAVQGVESMKPETISQHLLQSNEWVGQGDKRKPGKWREDKFPAPDGYLGKAPWWEKTRKAEIEAWFQRHPRRQKGDGIGGRKPTKDREPVSVPAAGRSGPVSVQRMGKVVEVTTGGQAEQFDTAKLRKAVELRREHPRSVSAVAEALASQFEMPRSQARAYASAAQKVIDAGLRL